MCSKHDIQFTLYVPDTMTGEEPDGGEPVGELPLVDVGVVATPVDVAGNVTEVGGLLAEVTGSVDVAANVLDASVLEAKLNEVAVAVVENTVLFVAVMLVASVDVMATWL